MNPSLSKLLNRIKDEKLRGKVSEFLEDSISVEIGGKTYAGMPLHESPAARFRHHSYPSGLLAHILSSTRIALTMCDSVEKIYRGEVNRDMVIAGLILHDILKPLVYEEKGDRTYRHSPLGEKVDHLTLVTSELIRRGFPLELIHIVASHHGEAGPVTPKTVEALICHLADWADSQMNGEVLKAAKYLVREVTGEFWEKMDSKTAFDIVHSKVSHGWNGLRETIEEKRQGGEDKALRKKDK